MSAKFKIKRIYDEPTKDDGYRMLIDRLWPRGVKKENAKLDEWNKDIAPSEELRKWFSHSEERFTDFADKYREELAGKRAEVKRILKLATSDSITFLYAAKDQEINHAVVLLQYLKDVK